MSSEPTEPTRTEPRAMLALIALAELPVPKAIHFYPHGLSLDFDHVADGQAWSAHLGGETGTYVNQGQVYLREGVITWQGWRVQIHASEPATPDTPLDEQTTARLSEIARCRS